LDLFKAPTSIKIIGFDLNIFVSTGSKTEEYKKILVEEINAQSLDCKIIEDLSRSGEVNAIIYSDDCEISDFSIFREDTIIFSIFAGVEKTLLNKTIRQPLVRLIDVEMTECMAEWCAAHVLRYHLDLDNYIKPTKKEWTISNKERLLADQVNIGVLGLGTLGSATARKLKKLDFNVSGWSATKKKLDGVKSLVGTEGLNNILSTSDYLILLLPLTKQTKTIINSESLKLVKNGEILINAGRGGLVEDNDLLEALDSGKLSECTLDVFNEEPLPPKHPFWYHDKVTVTPHISAPTRLKSSIRSILKNIGRIKKGLQPIGLVEKERYY
jgi:glyoxylate/hydroxypyruvate reductase A